MSVHIVDDEYIKNRKDEWRSSGRLKMPCPRLTTFPAVPRTL